MTPMFSKFIDMYSFNHVITFILSHEFNLELIFSLIRTCILINLIGTHVVNTHLVSIYSPKL